MIKKIQKNSKYHTLSVQHFLPFEKLAEALKHNTLIGRKIVPGRIPIKWSKQGCGNDADQDTCLR